MENVLRDLRYGCRMLWKNPGYTLIAVLTLALGIGANAAVFSVVNALLLRPMPYPNFERIAYVWGSDAGGKGHFSVSPHNFVDLRTRNQSFESSAAFQYASAALTGGGNPESLSCINASADFGKVSGVQPLRGRWFTAEEDVPGKNRVVVLSYGLWQRRFAGKEIVGQDIQLNGEAHTVIGIMPQTFNFPTNGIEAWKPLALDLSKYQRGTSFLQLMVRLKPGLSYEQAQAEILSVAQQITREFPQQERDLGFSLVSFREERLGDVERPLWILFGAVVLVLLIACVNVASLLLGRATVRWKEISVRAALGASRWNLIRLMLSESLMLGLLGGIFGLLLASFGVEWLTKINPDTISNPKDISIDRIVVGFTMLMSVITGIVFGALPAWQLTKTNLSQAMRESTRSASGSAKLTLIRNGLVVLEIAASLVLLVTAGLLLKSFWKLLEVNPGFRAENVVKADVSLPRAKYKDEWQQADFFRRALESVRAMPGVEGAAVTTNLPFNNGRGATSFNIDGRPTSPDSDPPNADNHEISSDYFKTMGIPIRAGRDFTDADVRTSPGVVIINEKLAQLYWPGENPIGRHLTIGSPQEEKLYGKPVSREIVGIIGNIKLLELTAEFNPEVYVPAAQMPSSGMTLVVRGASKPENLTNAIRQVVASIDPDQPIRRALALETMVARSIAPQRLIAMLLLVFAGLAIVLAVVGIYGVMNYVVTQRTQEIGIRLALGAQRADVLRMVIGQGMRLAGIGIGIGLIASFALSRLLTKLLFEVSSTDAVAYAGVSVLLAAVVLLACLIPARRASKVDPMIALRCE
ncbi:MAG TPA: ABC transporter permease [Blastocatellia bacterium]|nr:ABC transporter permease [Blastocatellia bacterium]